MSRGTVPAAESAVEPPVHLGGRTRRRVRDRMADAGQQRRNAAAVPVPGRGPRIPDRRQRWLGHAPGRARGGGGRPDAAAATGPLGPAARRLCARVFALEHHGQPGQGFRTPVHPLRAAAAGGPRNRLAGADRGPQFSRWLAPGSVELQAGGGIRLDFDTFIMEGDVTYVRTARGSSTAGGVPKSRTARSTGCWRAATAGPC